MIYTSLNFLIHVPDFCRLYYPKVSTMQFFRNNAIVPLFHTRVRTSHSPALLRLGNHTFGCFR